MAKMGDFDLDAALAALGREAAAASPRPGPDLVERVLADAATVAAERAATARARPAAGTAARRLGVFDAIFGWTSGAVAVMMLGLALGIGFGLEMDSGSLPILDSTSTQDDAPLAALEPPLLAMDFL